MSENMALSQRSRERSCGRPPYYRCEMGLNGEKWCPVRRAGPCPQAVVQQFDLQHGSPCPPTYNTATAHPNPIQKNIRGKGRWIIGSIWSDCLLSPLCCVLITLNLHFRKKKMVWLARVWEPGHEPNAVFIQPWVMELHYSQLSLYAETPAN